MCVKIVENRGKILLSFKQKKILKLTAKSRNVFVKKEKQALTNILKNNIL